MQELELSIQETSHLFSLPLHTEELGRLPVYDSFDYALSFESGGIPHQPQSNLESPYGPVDPALLYGPETPLIGETRRPRPL